MPSLLTPPFPTLIQQIPVLQHSEPVEVLFWQGDTKDLRTVRQRNELVTVRNAWFEVQKCAMKYGVADTLNFDY